MIHIKRFIDKVGSLDNKSNKDLVIPAQEARMLRDEIAKLLADIFERNSINKNAEPIEVHVNGGKW